MVSLCRNVSLLKFLKFSANVHHESGGPANNLDDENYVLDLPKTFDLFSG